jgi:hypothetical protein
MPYALSPTILLRELNIFLSLMTKDYLYQANSNGLDNVKAMLNLVSYIQGLIALMMEAINSSEISISLYRTIW